MESFEVFEIESVDELGMKNYIDVEARPLAVVIGFNVEFLQYKEGDSTIIVRNSDKHP